jgi:hypothetical protein
VKTATLNRMLGGATPFERLVNSDIGQRYLARARQNADAMERAAQESREQRSIPHVDAVRRKVAEAQRDALLSDDQPACTKFDAARVATECCNDDPRDHGLRRAALYLRKVWESDPDGALTVADLARAHERVCRDYPKSAARSLFDEAIPLVSFETLDRSGLAAIAQQIETQQDFDRVIVEYGLGGNDARSRRARQYVLALVNRQEDSASPRPFDRSAVSPPNVSEETIHELKDDPSVDNPFAVAWDISKKKESARRADAPDAGEQAFHPKPEEQQPDALKVEDGVVKGGKNAQAETYECKGCGLQSPIDTFKTTYGQQPDGTWRPGGDPASGQAGHGCPDCGGKDIRPVRSGAVKTRAKESSDEDFSPEVNQQQPDQVALADADAHVKAAQSEDQDTPYTCSEHGGSHHYKACSQCGQKYCPQNWKNGCPLCEVGLKTTPIQSSSTDAPQDAQLGEQVETLVNQHQTQNAPAEQRERGATVSEKRSLSTGMMRNSSTRISRQRVEDAILSGSTVEIGSYRLRIASPGGRDQVEMRGPDVPPMAWPIRKLTAAVEYFAETCEDAVRTGQAMVPSRVNEQQPDQVQVPSDLGPESSAEEPDQMTPAVKEQHDGLDQSGTSKSDFEGTATDDQNVAWSDVTPIQQGWPKQPGTSDSLDPEPNPLGQHSSDAEYPGLAPTVEPSSKRADIRAALKGGFGR